MNFNFIYSIEDLAFLNEELLLRPFVGVDTEFRRTTKDNMRLALLQVNDGEEIYLIDTLLINNPRESCSFLFSESVIKIFHSCKEDLEAIHSWTGKRILNIFDTQLAEAFLGGLYSISYQDLVEKKMGIIVDKGETRSNWIRRPLTDSQLIYAASDVEFLIELFNEQHNALSKSKKLCWHNEDLELMSSRIFAPVHLEDEPIRLLSKSQERSILNDFHEIVLQIATAENVNPTMLFSKKNQKELLRSILNKGLDEALNEITNWRSELFKDPLSKLISML